jgi:hypothetical protein
LSSSWPPRLRRACIIRSARPRQREPAPLPQSLRFPPRR